MRVHTLLVVVCLVVGVPAAFAQQTSPVQAGVLGGVTWFHPSLSIGAESVTFDAGVGWTAGMFLTTPANGPVSFQPEWTFAEKRTESAQPGGVLLKQRFRSIDVPLLLRLTTARHGSTSVHVLAGPAFTFRTGAEQTTIVGGSVTREDTGDEVRVFDTAIAVGAGIDAGRWLVDMRYMHGLRNVLNDPSGNATARLRTVTVVTGVRF